MNTDAFDSLSEPGVHGSRIKSGMTALSSRLESLADAECDQLPLWLPVGLGLGTAAWFALPTRAWDRFLLLAAARRCPQRRPRGVWWRAFSLFCLAAILGCANSGVKRIGSPRGAEPSPRGDFDAGEIFQRLRARPGAAGGEARRRFRAPAASGSISTRHGPTRLEAGAIVRGLSNAAGVRRPCGSYISPEPPGSRR